MSGARIDANHDHRGATRSTPRADVIYLCLADYRDHHRPEGFLPPAFSDFEVTRGGVGAGTEASWTVTTGGRPRTIRATITEPEPGHTLLETAEGVETTFTVDPAPDGAVVRFETVIDDPACRASSPGSSRSGSCGRSTRTS